MHLARWPRIGALALALLGILVFGLRFPAQARAEPPPAGTIAERYATDRAFPTDLDFAPDGRIFYTEKGDARGQARVMTLAGAPGALTEQPWLELTGLDTSGERGLLSVALDPDFAINRFVYVFYTVAQPLANRVVRYTERRSATAPPQADPSSALILMEIPIPPTVYAWHNGGNLHIGPDGFLYVTHGELTIANWAQDLRVAPGKIHRIDPAPPYNDEPNAAQAPPDNPFYDDGNPALRRDDRIWSYGHRNSFDFTFDRYDPPGPQPPSYHIIATENGNECNDEIIRVVRGYNYRWPVDYHGCEHPPEPATGPRDDDPPIPALAFYRQTIGPVGIVVYTGAIPEWRGDLFFCAVNTQQLYRARLDATRTALLGPPEPVALPEGIACVLDVETGSDGALYFTTPEAIFRIRSEIAPPPCLNFIGAPAVGLDDVQLVASAWHHDPRLLPRYNINGDGAIDVADLTLLVAAWGQGCE